MKICKLKLKNLNSFRESVEIDFENPPLDDASLVAITGPTGAGKTTLLDAICVALYGKTPRLSGTGSQNPSHLISHGEKEGFAEVHFMANGTRYLATWSAKQKGPPKVQLLYAEGGKLISDKLSARGKSMGSSQNTVSEEVESILGLDFDAFKRSVMLAQGEFAAFLKANNEERRTILEATAGISIYDVLKQVLNDKVGEVEAVNAAVVDELNKIPVASREQLTETETELGKLQTKAAEIVEKSQQIQQEKDRETKRTEDFKKLGDSTEKRETLLNRQPEIEARRTELENANRAQRLLPEKQAFDNAKSELENAADALSSAETETTEAEERVKADQTVFDEKATAYQTASDERDQKMAIYTDAKSNVERADERFAEREKRTPDLVDLGDQINTLESQLDDRQIKQAQLQEQIASAQRFLDENSLPSNPRDCLKRANGFLSELILQEKLLETASATKTQHEKKVSSLKRGIKELSKTREKHLSDKSDAEVKLKDVSVKLNTLQEVGSREEWNERKKNAHEAQPIAQEYETVNDDLVDSEDDMRELNEAKAGLDAELEQIEVELTSQTDVCQRAMETVQHCEESRESAMFASPINQLRQRLQPGEPCSVCGATEHPHAHVVEPESEELLQNAEDALTKAKTDADDAQAQLQALKTRQAQTEQNIRNTDAQIEDCDTEIESLRNQRSKLLTRWQEIYPNIDISSDWIAEQIEAADTAIADLGEVEQAHTQASHACEIAFGQLKTCENDIERETKSLSKTEEQLQNIGNDVEDLKVTIANIETRFSDVLPKTFRGVTPKDAVDQFENKIKEVEACEDERRSAATQLQVLNTNVKADQGTLGNLKERHETLRAEIDEYRREGEAFLDTVREKTGGLTTEDEIDTAIKNLEAELQAKEIERDAAEQQLQNSRNVLTQKQTAHEIGEKQFNVSVEKLDASRQVYFNKLEKEGFGVPEAHDNAFRDDDQIQDLINQIDAHKNEMQRLALEITELQTRFEETPFDPEVLGRIETKLEEIETQLQAKREEIGAQGERVDNLKDALEKREALGDDMRTAQQELERWRRLQETIPANALRDFALEIMFRQMGSLANEQLKYLTSERYQLKVEGIGDLSVVDRWNANEERPVETLSGGESFLTSLALALALSELSRGRAQLNSLFLDEGFGTLDTETLDIAISALEGLRMQGRNIFLISHIQELTRRLPVKINVRKQGNGSSSIEIRG